MSLCVKDGAGGPAARQRDSNEERNESNTEDDEANAGAAMVMTEPESLADDD